MELKKIGSAFLVALAGGAIAAGTTLYFTQQNNSAFSDNPTKFNVVSNLPPNAENVDLTIAAEATLNSVVHIKTVSKQEVQQGFDPFQDFFFGQPQFQQPKQRDVSASGSGVIISTDGYIATNNHVVEGATEIEVTLNDNKSYKAEIIGTDPTTDLALIKVDAKDLSPVLYGNSDDVKVGQWVLVGHGRWTRGVNIEDANGPQTIRAVDPKDCMLVSDERQDNMAYGDKEGA